MKFYLGLLILLPSITMAQLSKGDFKKKYLEAEGHYDDQNFQKALPIYKELLASDKENGNLKYKIGECHFNLDHDKSEAIKYFEEAKKSVSEVYDPTSHKERSAPIDLYLNLGKAYHLSYKFEEAEKVFKKYKMYASLEEMADEAAFHLGTIETAKKLMQNPVSLKITNMGGAINSKYPEYAPVISADERTLIFTSRREGSTGGKLTETDFQPYEDIYISRFVAGAWSAPEGIGKTINTAGHEATIGLSVDGQQLLIYRGEGENDGNIYISKLKGDRWQVPVKMSSSINTRFNETHACFSPDGREIYFTSDRKGGYGGLDIYRVRKLPNGEWSQAQNLGPKINTSSDERAPFLHPDGVTLFFSSEGHETMGGMDILFSTVNSKGIWSKPHNIGYPINTTGNDVFYVTSPDGKRAYYASRQDGGYGETDLYLIQLEQELEVVPLTIMTGKITFSDKDDSVPEGTTISVYDNGSGELVGVYKPNSKTGKYLFILQPGSDYNLVYESSDYIFQTENLQVPMNSDFNTQERVIELQPVEVGNKIILNNVFFDFDKADLRESSYVELQKLYTLMVNNSEMKVEIEGHTDSKGDEKYNKDLSLDRAKTVREYLVNRGIKDTRMSVQAFGEERPIAKDTNEDGTENEQGMQLNRRIELNILSNSEAELVNPIKVPENLQKKK